MFTGDLVQACNSNSSFYFTLLPLGQRFFFIQFCGVKYARIWEALLRAGPQNPIWLDMYPSARRQVNGRYHYAGTIATYF